MGGKVSKEVRKRSREKLYEKLYFEIRRDDITRQDIDAAAKLAGTSRQSFIVDAIKEKMQRIGYVVKKDAEEAGNSGL